MENIVHENRSNKQAGIAILIPDKKDFKPKLIRRGREGHYILIKGKIHQEDSEVLNIYAMQAQGHLSSLKNTTIAKFIVSSTM